MHNALSTDEDYCRLQLRYWRFHTWLVRRDAIQRAENVRLQAQVATLERVLERETAKATKALHPFSEEKK